MPPKQERSRETEAAIIRAAIKLVSGKNSDEITIREICTEAGVSVGAFYHHFRSRHELYQRFFEGFDQEVSRRIALYHQSKPPLEALTELLLFQTCYAARETQGAAHRYLTSILNDPFPPSVDPNRPYYQLAYDCVHRLAASGRLYPQCPPERIAELCILFVRGCLVDWCLHEHSYDVVERVRFCLPILYRGFLKEPV